MVFSDRDMTGSRDPFNWITHICGSNNSWIWKSTLDDVIQGEQSFCYFSMQIDYLATNTMKIRETNLYIVNSNSSIVKHVRNNFPCMDVTFIFRRWRRVQEQDNSTKTLWHNRVKEKRERPELQLFVYLYRLFTQMSPISVPNPPGGNNCQFYSQTSSEIAFSAKALQYRHPSPK